MQNQNIAIPTVEQKESWKQIKTLQQFSQAAKAYADQIGCKQFYVEAKMWDGKDEARYTVTYYAVGDKNVNPSGSYETSPIAALVQAAAAVEIALLGAINDITTI